MGHTRPSHAFSLYYYILTKVAIPTYILIVNHGLFMPHLLRIEPHRLPPCQPVLPDSQCENDSPRRNPKQKMPGTIEVGEALEP